MDRTTIVRAILVPLITLPFLTACETGEDATPSAGDPPSTTTGTGTTTPVLDAPPGSYRYEGLGVEAVLAFDGRTASLRIANSTGSQLGEPHLYVLRADDGSRIDLTTADPAPVPTGEDLRFQVAFESEPPPIGLIFLVFGEDDFGAFVPVKGPA
jgi:hypothetical protein